MSVFRSPGAAIRTFSLALLVVLTLGAAPATRAGLPEYASPGEALQAVLAEYVARIAPGLTFRLGPIKSQGAWAYAIAQEVDDKDQPVSERQVALLAHQEPGGSWIALAPGIASAADYNALLTQFPDVLLDPGYRAYLRLPERTVRVLATYGGYRLPWPAGQIGYVTQKGATADEPNHTNQVDFDIQGTAAAGDVYAAKPGQVVFVRQDSNTGGCGGQWCDTNLVVIQHGPTEYSWYLHLAQNSVPVHVGDWVGWGTKIGVEGETGNACGVHLHFMVSTSHTPWTLAGDPNYLPWPASPEDIVAVDFYESSWVALTDYWTCGCNYRSTNSSSLNTATPTPDSTPTPTPQTSCQDVLRNGGFETNSDWSFLGGVPGAFSTREARTGTRSLRLGLESGPPYYCYSSAEQSLTLPTGPATARLAFWYRVISSDPSGGKAYVLLRDASQGLHTLGYLNLAAPDWTAVSFDTSAYLGQTVAVRFTAVNGATGGAVAVYVDDASWTVCSDATPSPPVTTTPTTPSYSSHVYAPWIAGANTTGGP